VSDLVGQSVIQSAVAAPQQGKRPAKNASALPVALSAALAVKALIRLFIKCKIMALWLTELR